MILYNTEKYSIIQYETELNNKKVVVIGDTTSNDEDIIENKGFTDLLIINIE